MKRAIVFLLPVFCLSIDSLACSSHPGQSHEDYVTSLRKRTYDQPAPSTYSTAIGNPAKAVTKSTEGSTSPNSAPPAGAAAQKNTSFFDSVGR